MPVRSPRALAAVLTLAVCACQRAPIEAKKAAEPEAHAPGHIEELNVLELSLDAQRRSGVVVEPVREQEVRARLQAPGVVQPLESRLATLRPLGRGRLTQILVRIGDSVKKDQLLARFDNLEAAELATQIDSARAELRRLELLASNARRQAERARNLRALGAIPQQEAEATETEASALVESIAAQRALVAGLETRLKRFAAQNPAESPIRAPFDAVVLTAPAAPGNLADPSEVLFTLADLRQVYVEAQVFERDLAHLRPGLPVTARFEAFPHDSFAATVDSIRPQLDAKTRAAAVRCLVANPALRLRLEMFATVEIPTTRTHSALALPAEAVQTIQRRNVVFVRKGALHFEARPVEILGDGERLEITAGLTRGEAVVTRGAFAVKSAFLARELQSEHGHD